MPANMKCGLCRISIRAIKAIGQKRRGLGGLVRRPRGPARCIGLQPSKPGLAGDLKSSLRRRKKVRSLGDVKNTGRRQACRAGQEYFTLSGDRLISMAPSWEPQVFL